MTPPVAKPASAAVATGPLPPWCQPAWDLLAARAAQGTLPHALLVCGPAGLGKRNLVDAFARACLCEAPADGHACGRCRGCKLLAAGTHPDFVRVVLEVNPKTGNARHEIVVDQIRALSERLAMASQLGGRQVAVIDPADAMNAAAQNALLKTLEEPTAASLIVLVSDRPWRLVATVRSRCQRLDVTLPPHAAALQWLVALAPDGAEAALDAAGGNPGEALRLLQEGGMERRRTVAADLAALAAGRGDARAISKTWAADEPLQRLEFAARLLADALNARVRQAPVAFDPDSSDVALVAQFDAADRLRLLLDGPLRTDLALFEWLAGLSADGH